MKNRSVWLTTGLIFLIVLVFVFVLFGGMEPDFESELLNSEPQTNETEVDDDEEETTSAEEVTEENDETEEPLQEDPIEETDIEEGTSEYTIQAGDHLEGIADEFGVSMEDLQYWNQLFEPSALNEGATLIVDGPNAEQAQKEEWQWVFEQNLYDTYGVTVEEYEASGDGYYAVYVNEVETQGTPYVTVNSDTGEYSR